MRYKLCLNMGIKPRYISSLILKILMIIPQWRNLLIRSIISWLIPISCKKKFVAPHEMNHKKKSVYHQFCCIFRWNTGQLAARTTNKGNFGVVKRELFIHSYAINNSMENVSTSKYSKSKNIKFVKCCNNFQSTEMDNSHPSIFDVHSEIAAFDNLCSFSTGNYFYMDCVKHGYKINWKLFFNT